MGKMLYVICYINLDKSFFSKIEKKETVDICLIRKFTN